ncbi:MAG TPA: branched-chain amino acid aminotransferase [Candidatus Anaerotruncus excrementipullorum]|uniref:Branched-chain-amino-acid aminotransferase n=1 Tax=Candidatus Anaerotruncus excrementipullorum TaxID=2838465 RepID=A0A9D1WRD2_9FIRM|nr:branched-chain amino acid aminotransferase [Candidatus Anaerotruncus excrementipullorum]
MEIKVTLTDHPKAKPDQNKLGFGRHFTDHMFLMDYTAGKGWHDPRIVPYGPITMDPCCACLHYAQEVFEGLKAYRTADGQVQLFRPQENFKRLNTSCDRLVIPHLDEEFCLEALKKLIEIEKDWVPSVPGASLYIRPFIIARQEVLGVHPSVSYLYCVILSPSGDYYANGLAPVKIYVETNYVRAASFGGMGAYKTGGNYAASLIAQEEAERQGYDQALWLDGVERKYVEEVGSMNVFFKIDGEIITPNLDGSILPGITRKSAIQLLADWGMKVTERKLSIQELEQAAREGKLDEAWGTGTAAVISPIGELKCGDTVTIINDNKIGPVSQRLFDTLTGIQWGRLPDPHNWIVPCC